MNDQQILEFISAKQPLRAVQLADKFDKSEREASEALRALVDIGDVVRKSGTGPNGQPAQFYTLSETFLKSRPGQLLIASQEAAAASTPTPTPAPTPAVSVTSAPTAAQSPALVAAQPPTPAPAPQLSPADDTSTRRIERAIAHIKEHGPTSDADIRQVLCLRADQYPSNFIGRAVKDGRLAKDGRDWTLGPGTPPAPLKRQATFGGALGLAGSTPQTQPKRVEIPTFLAAKPARVADCVAAPILEDARAAAAPPSFRCGLWSDGVLELQRNGVTVAELEQGEGETVAAFMARLRQPLETA